MNIRKVIDEEGRGKPIQSPGGNSGLLAAGRTRDDLLVRLPPHHLLEAAQAEGVMAGEGLGTTVLLQAYRTR